MVKNMWRETQILTEMVSTLAGPISPVFDKLTTEAHLTFASDPPFH